MIARFFLLAPSEEALFDNAEEYHLPRNQAEIRSLLNADQPQQGPAHYDVVWTCSLPHKAGERDFFAKRFISVLEGDPKEVVEAASSRQKSDTEKLINAPFFGGDFAWGMNVPAKQWQHWHRAAFGTSADMRQLIGADLLSTNRMTGNGVNVLLVDRGVNAASLGAAYGGGIGIEVPGILRRMPGSADQPYVHANLEHGNAMARRILSLAPQARIYDAPFIPDRIDDVVMWSAIIAASYQVIREFIDHQVTSHGNQGPWVIVSAWGIFDRRYESLPGTYTTRPNHPLNLAVRDLSTVHDVIFSAGNNGQFSPDIRAGPYDIGPGRSIFGANALPSVISAGAVNVNGMWVGASSQGPGPQGLAPPETVLEKPDISAPSWYFEDRDRAIVNSGTSTAAAVVAGTVAALRERFRASGANPVTPADLLGALRQGATKFIDDNWNNRTGEGVLSVSGTLANLPPLPNPPVPTAKIRPKVRQPPP